MMDQHCPGFEANKTLNEVICKCPDCGTQIELFSDELEKEIVCKKCGKKLDKSHCTPA
ncbi:MAG: hypothetical protein K9L30_09800 [Desulfobacterales bacterium]|nr:hypothetical protein [Desulfobacterales bacterium]